MIKLCEEQSITDASVKKDLGDILSKSLDFFESIRYFLSKYDFTDEDASEIFSCLEKIGSINRYLQDAYNTKPLSQITKDTKIKDWYKKTYPDDDIYEDINPNVTFKDVMTALQTPDYPSDIEHDLIGVGDSIVRERIGSRLADMYNINYNDIYDMFSQNYFYVKRMGTR